ncbi:sigma 54-interacting transcriptional regulator [Bacillus sp. FJAT-50079]|uniref:sigma 54-interacting transcriptional regulator n=1 Tax=Bacillus sp. FJAT-50079 TaxID=2833577 RepID=UPI001BCA0D85|nr:sigma 54-interacting transcriptional regulator [Bacillus sp. FJAT-50079]MBS4210292.1 sigma 54-interacting transcriptional regulator [Bacillus sp. FJAT-50079]
MIGVIAPYSQFKEEVEEIAKTLHIPVIVEVGALRAGLYKAKKMIKEHQVKVIIARGATANFLKQQLDIPIVKIDVTNFDIMKTLSEAKKLDDTIVLIDHVENRGRTDLNSIKEMLQVQILLKEYENEKDIAQHIHTVAEVSEQRPIVGTAECMAKTAGNKGVQSFIVFSQTDSIREALWRAKESLEQYEKEELKQKHLESVISHAFAGVIATDRQGIVTVCNDVAARHLDIRPSDIIGRNLTNIHLPLFKKLIGDSKAASRKVIKNGNRKYMINRVCLDQHGMVIHFQEAEEILQNDTKMRSELYHRRFYAKYTFEEIIYRSDVMERMISLAKAYAKSDSNVLIYGESGTGKELIAQSIHNESERKSGPFIAVNCAALPENLLESELFGYEDGAFTGAKKGGKPGLFEMAHGGTIFLDEIGEITPALQARLLRVLQEKEVRRIGGERIIPIDIRVLSATNKDLLQLIQTEEFRSDLYYRLNILHIHLPPLRDRKEDIDLLIDALLKKHQGNIKLITEETRRMLHHYDWPGNIRELENVIERAVAVGSQFHEQMIHLLPRRVPIHVVEKVEAEINDYVRIKVGSLAAMERQIFDAMSRRFEGNQTELAEHLGISRTTLWKKMKKVD